MAYTSKKRQQLKRIRQFISRAEKRGYRFDAEFKNQLTGLSTQKLKNLTPKKLMANKKQPEGNRLLKIK